ncbi:MAG TPA: hypothetical protein VFO41_04805 [Alphaproteobacteria bacterium]|nr:hypothetical protein [Alphaproteobacteria bacterium]
MDISVNTLVLAIKAIDRDIKRHEGLLEDEALSDEDAELYGQTVLDLSRALSELGGAYQAARRDHPELPALEDWIDAE